MYIAFIVTLSSQMGQTTYLTVSFRCDETSEEK